ncbi:hypothetical protein FIBSPDRAFT_967634 [Athelia psychrophila]|uniref:Uncharacterized protein n=1 Tax=Athelia psychrophila TaxID=1759441 RepID=A0A167VHS6_9AGAM|nr:hypothetical protein FIBSPDRAFT_967634 [Fibularhizoctonia sp. CBS 109695]
MPPPAKKATSSSSRVSSRADSASTSGAKASTPSVQVMVNKMDNTMNHMMDVFSTNMASDRGKAVCTIQTKSAENVPGGWDVGDITLMIEVFSYHLNLAESYLALEGAVRKGWVQCTLDHLHAKILAGATIMQAVNSLGRE